MKSTFLFIVFVLCVSVTDAQPVKRLYIANDDHTDYMWTANEATYDTAFVHMLDYYLRQIDSTKADPADFQARFNCDGSYWLRAYQKYRSPAQFDRLMAAIRSGHISSPLNTLVSCYGAQPTEAVIRGMYYAGQLERGYKLRFTLVQAMENNTIPLGLASLWAGSGAKYSYKGIGGYGSQMTYEYRDNRRNQLYRYAGLDGSGVLMKWYTYNEKTAAPLGGYAECRLYPKKRPVSQTEEIGRVITKLDAFCDTISSQSTYPFNVAGAFGYGWDDLDTYTSTPFIEAARNGTTPTRRVRVSNEEDFFRDVARSYPRLPSESVSYGNEWDLYCASMNETTARVRRSTEKLRAAEGLAALVALRVPVFANQLIAPANRTARNLAWESLGMYWEHNWTADGPVKQAVRAAWQEKIQRKITSYVDSLFVRSARALGSQLKEAALPRFYVFNPLSWTRSDIADFAYTGTYPVRVIDVATGKEAASQLITIGGKRFLRIHAEAIPSVGYKVFELTSGVPAPLPVAARVTTTSIGGKTVRTARYRIRLSPSGAITDLYDSLAGRQLVQPIEGRYVNDLGVANVNEGNPVVVENAGPVSVTVKAVSPVPVPHTVRVTVFANNARIEIEDSIQANFADVKTWAFSFNLTNPTTRHEELGAILTAKKETRGGHYASQNARLDWQTFNHFADMSEARYGVTLSNVDCSFFKLGKSTVDSLWEQSLQLNALAGGQVDTKLEDKGVLGIRGQNGQTQFLYKFALTTHPVDFDPLAAMKFSMEHQNPLVTGAITGSQNIYPSPTFSLLTTNDANLLLWSLKPSEDGTSGGGATSGLITRFWNVGSQPATPTLTLSSPVRRAWQTTHIETNERVLKPVGRQLQVRFAPHQLNTYRLQLAN